MNTGVTPDEAVRVLRDGTRIRPALAIILGGGLGAVVAAMESGVCLPYSTTRC